jgi:hypothetical protein
MPHLFILLVFTVSALVVNGTTPSWQVSPALNFKQQYVSEGVAKVQEKYNQIVQTWTISHITNNEVWYAMQLLFYGKINGISIELGALSGTMATRCETETLEQFNWKRILIEANPIYKKSLSSLSHAFSVNAAICNSSQFVHYVMNTKDPYVNGIVEFMHPNFLKKFHPDVLKFQHAEESGPYSYDWPSELPSSLVEIPCISMQTVLSTAGITHVNLWLLDTEGAELSILRTVDWSSVIFDVIIVETEVKNRSNEYARNVKEYLEARGYVLMALKRGRNSWYRHQSFVTATKAPVLKSYMHFLNNVVYADSNSNSKLP